MWVSCRKFLSELHTHTHTQPCDKSIRVVASQVGRVDTVEERNKTEKRMTDNVVPQSLANRHLILKAVVP